MYMYVFFKKKPSTETTKHCKQRTSTLKKLGLLGLSREKLAKVSN